MAPAHIRLFFVCVFSFLSASSWSAPPPDISDMLRSVATSLRTSDYSGRLTYEHSGKLEIIEIAHAVIDGVEYEKVDYLNGPPRNLTRSGRSAQCNTTGERLLAGGLVQTGRGNVALDQFYEYRLLGEERVAGRDSWVLQLVPKDAHRLGFMLAVDQQSYLPTKSLFLGGGRKVLERLHFVSLETDVSFDPEMFSAAEKVSVASSDCVEKNLDPQSPWQPQWLPDGFILANTRVDSKHGHIETYTDGLASFSIFVRHLDGAAPAGDSMAAGFKKGATVAVMTRLPDQQAQAQISVLGEIPKETARRILSSVSKQ